jgi:hypothetical protein
MRSILLISLLLALAATYVSASTGTQPAPQQTTAAGPAPTDGGTGGAAPTTAAAQPPAPTTAGNSGFKVVGSLATFTLAALLGRLLI